MFNFKNTKNLLAGVIGSLIFLSSPVLAQSAKGPDPLPYKGPAVEMCLSFDCKDGHGSGVYLGMGYFLTAKHVSAAAPDGVLYAVSDHSGYYKIVDVWDAGGADLSLFKSTDIVKGLPPAKLSCEKGEVDENIYTVGNPGPFKFMKSVGIISGFMGEIEGAPWKDFIVSQLTIYFGNSGGPVFSMFDDKVIALAVGKLDTSNFSILEPTWKICNLLPSEIAP